MPNAFNLVTITRAPVNGIITLDYVTDGIDDGDGGCRNIELVVDGAELKGLAFTENGSPAEYGDTSKGLLITLRTPNVGDYALVRNVDGSVTNAAKILVTGNMFADAYLTRANHIGAWTYNATLGHYVTELNLWSGSGNQRAHVMPTLTSLVAGTTVHSVYRGPTATITGISLVLEGGLSIGAATVQLAINGVDVTNGEVSIPLLGAAAGEVYATTPSAANTITDGDVLRLTTGGVNLLATRANVTLAVQVT